VHLSGSRGEKINGSIVGTRNSGHEKAKIDVEFKDGEKRRKGLIEQ